MEYIVRSSHLIPAIRKGEFPDIIHRYIANDSAIGFHYNITDEPADAYIFNEFELEHAEFIASCWGMTVIKK